MAKKKEETAPKKTKCAISRKQFFDNAKPLTIEINGQKQVAEVKEFSTGSFGWYFTGKIVVEVQANCGLVAVGSKEEK